jgi:hypothetical protein
MIMVEKSAVPASLTRPSACQSAAVVRHPKEI